MTCYKGIKRTSGEDIASKIMATEDSELYAKSVAAKVEMVKVVAESEVCGT